MPTGKLKGCGIGSGYMQKFLKKYPVKQLQKMYNENGIKRISSLFTYDGLQQPSDDSTLRVIKSMGVIPRKQGENLSKLNKK